MKGRLIRLGVVGMGPSNMASTLALLKDVPDLRFRLQAICTRRPEVQEECRRKFDVPVATTDVRELVSRPDVDVVCVFSPDDLHAGNVPFIYARISPQWPNAELVRSSQERVSKELSAVAMVNADDLATPTRHYDNEGTLRLGGRFAAAFEQVVTVQLSESAEPPTPR